MWSLKVDSKMTAFSKHAPSEERCRRKLDRLGLGMRAANQGFVLYSYWSEAVSRRPVLAPS